MNLESKKVLIELRDGLIGADTAESLINREIDPLKELIEKLEKAAWLKHDISPGITSTIKTNT